MTYEEYVQEVKSELIENGLVKPDDIDGFMAKVSNEIKECHEKGIDAYEAACQIAEDAQK